MLSALQAISRYRGTHIQSPNFGYKLAARKFLDEQASRSPSDAPLALDLSTVRHMFNAVGIDGLWQFLMPQVPRGVWFC